MFKVKVRVTPKKGILDPQGQAVENALRSMRYGSVESVRIGKYMEIMIQGEDEGQVEAQVNEMCQKLLANPVIEDYSFEMERIK
ncbi:MAG: phosphoribosylformylglycinamidine synthase subunit PurS [Firmicutes bacterium]|nr:phosphoribosylformylglycinamidine synthase subunit PurS [Bacillota bacterium]